MSASVQHIAHLNWGYLRAPWGDPAVAGFTDNVGKVNDAAARSADFVARPDGPAEAIFELIEVQGHDGPPQADRVAATFSVWRTPQALEAFVYRTIHGQFVKRRSDWFVPQGDVPAYVVFPVAAGAVPDIREGVARIKRLRAEGPSAEAYDFGWMRAHLQEAAQ